MVLIYGCTCGIEVRRFRQLHVMIGYDRLDLMNNRNWVQREQVSEYRTYRCHAQCQHCRWYLALGRRGSIR